MNIQVQGRRLVISDVLRQHTEHQLSRLAESRPELKHVVAHLSISRQGHRVELRLWGDNLELCSEEQGTDMYSCVIRATEKLERQLQKFYDRHYRFGNHHGQHDSPRYSFLSSR